MNDLEDEILGLLLLKPDLMKQCVISEELFLDRTNKFIFNLFKKQYSDSKTISIVGLAENYKYMFSDNFKVNEIISKLSELMSEAIPVNNFSYYQETLLARYIQNEILHVVDLYKTEKISTEEMLDQIHKFESMSIKTEAGKKTAEEIFKLINSKNKSIKFRLKKLSDYIDIKEQDLVVIGARPSVGKTAFMLNLFEDLSKKYNCIFFSMEMSEIQIYRRLVSINTTIPIKCLNTIETDYQKEAIELGCKNISNNNLKVYFGGQTIRTLKRTIANESKNGHVVAFIDYAGLIGGKNSSQSIYEHLTSVLKELRRVTLDFDCTIFLAAQLNRNADDKKEPKLSELKETGELEQSATEVIFLHNENFENTQSLKEIELSIIIAKNRDGKTGKTKLKYNRENQRFEEINKY